MIPADQLPLITAAVDGELSATEARAFSRLIESSAEARALFTKFQADRARLQSLPLAEPPADLREKILARIVDATPAPLRLPARTTPMCPVQPAQLPQPPQPARAARGLPTWTPAAIAAGLLLGITLGSFAYFTNQPGTTLHVKSPWGHNLPAPKDAPSTVPSPHPVPHPDQPRPDPQAVVHNDVSPVPSLPRPVPPSEVAIAPPPRSGAIELHGAGLLPKIRPFDLVQVRVPFLRTVAELDREDVRQELVEELGHDQSYRFDVFVRDTARGAEVFQAASKAAGLSLFADAATIEKLRKKQAHAVVVYTEHLTAAELVRLFAKLSAEDAKYSPRVCDSLHAMPTHRSDELELKAILGPDFGPTKRPVGSGGVGTGQGGEKGDKSVSAGTLDSVTKSLTSPPAKSGEKSAVLMTWATNHPSISRTNPATSAELKQFLAKRGDRKSNAVPAIIVIRPVG